SIVGLTAVTKPTRLKGLRHLQCLSCVADITRPAAILPFLSPRASISLATRGAGPRRIGPNRSPRRLTRTGRPRERLKLGRMSRVKAALFGIRALGLRPIDRVPGHGHWCPGR